MFIANPSFLNQKPKFATMMFALCSLVAVSLPLLFQLPAGVNVVFALFLAIRIGLLHRGIYQLPMWQNILLLMGATIFVLQQLGTIFGLQGGISFLLLLALLKSYEGNTKRDWQILVVVMMFLLAGAILFDDGMVTGLWSLFCLMLMAMTLALCNEVAWQQAIKQSALAFMLTLLPMVVLFIAVPRSSTPFFGLPQSNPAASTGISDRLKPGSIGELVLSNQPAFTAHFTQGFTPKPQQLYWRVMVLGRKVGNEWQATQDFMDNALAPTQPQVSYQMVVDEDPKGHIPALDYINNNEKRGLWIEVGNTLRIRPQRGVRRLNLSSSVSDELPHRLSPAEIRFYTQLPNQSNPRTQALAKQIYQQSQGNAESFARLAYQYFQKQGFTYTLKPAVLSEQNSTDQFIFQSKQGFCEHYADAFVTVMRSAGVPARIVVGYQGGEFNPSENFWQIRSKDAHAWAEVWLADRQVWKRIDPTAAVSNVRIENGVGQALPEEVGELVQNTGIWTQWTDRGRYYWQQWVVNYDNERQQNLFNFLNLGKVGLGSIVLLLGIGGIMAAVPLWLWWRKSRPQKSNHPLENGFALLKETLLGADFPQIDALTAHGLMNYLRQNKQLSPALDALLRDYVDLNYAHATLDMQAAKRWYVQAKRFARQYRQRRTS